MTTFTMTTEVCMDALIDEMRGWDQDEVCRFIARIDEQMKNWNLTHDLLCYFRDRMDMFDRLATEVNEKKD